MMPVTVVAPVLRRPQNAEPFMASLRASMRNGGSTPPVVAVANWDDEATAEAWRRAGAQVAFVTGTGSFGQKANHAANLVPVEWMFLVGDDVAFHEGWLDNALRDLPDHVCVVGTNDLGTPAVQAGEHATHMLIRMNYIRERGASWDGPGTVCGPYRHWFTDNELVTVAKLRGVWEARSDSVVEHLHPYFARGGMDDVYRIGEEHSAADGRLWMSRLRKFAPHLLDEPLVGP